MGFEIVVRYIQPAAKGSGMASDNHFKELYTEFTRQRPMLRVSVKLLWPLAAVLGTIGTVLIVSVLSGIAVTYLGKPQGERMGWLLSETLIVGIAICLVAAGIAFCAYTVPRALNLHDEHDRQRFDAAQIGLGFALALMCLLVFVGFMGLEQTGLLDLVLDHDLEKQVLARISDDPVLAALAPEGAGFESTKARVEAASLVRLVLYPTLACTGALFYISGAINARRRKWHHAEMQKIIERPAPPPESDDASTAESDKPAVDRTVLELFSASGFWAGFWYRLSEAGLFALVVYLLFKLQSVSDTTLPDVDWLPLLALLLGMLVKPAETLILGLGTRLLASVEALVK